MLRAVWLTVINEARLLFRDPIVLFMLLFAPIVIITVAGYSLGSLYGGMAGSFRVPLIDRDHGPVAAAIVGALRRERSITVEIVDDREQARSAVSDRDRTPIALEIPAGTSAAMARGEQSRLVLYVDPVRRIEVNALELKIDELNRGIAEQARLQAQARLDREVANLVERIGKTSAALVQEQARATAQLRQFRNDLQTSIQTQIAAALTQARRQSQQSIQALQSRAWTDVQNQLVDRQTALVDLQNYLAQLQSSQRAFEDWLATLRELADKHGAHFPPPPAFPAPPPATEMALLNKPITAPRLDLDLPAPVFPEAISIDVPAVVDGALVSLSVEPQQLLSFAAVKLPRPLGFTEQPAIDGEAVAVNAFDQYVPGFGITFLLIGMMLGIALTLFDERDWGTLKRLQVSGAPLTGLLMGKLLARFVVGTIQMALLFAVGWALFGISLGRHPIALLIPTAGISFAAAALGLLIASVARAHDSVMPLGTVTSMSLAAIGGCWWPLDFEPSWMRAVASWLPTTWSMEAFNDLMIRNLPATSVLWPFAATMGLGAIFLAIGTFRLVSFEE